MKDFRRDLKSKRLYFDGGFGTLLQGMGLKSEAPEIWNVTNPQRIIEAHKAYIDAGSVIITANTFGINKEKYDDYEALIEGGIGCAKEAAGKKDIYIALDIGPTGRMLEPLGDLPFEKAVEIFAANVKKGVECGVDLILIETMNDLYETKAAVVAAKENSDLPIVVTNAYDRSGKLMTGADPAAVIAALEGLGVDAIGMNCSFGPDLMTDLADEYLRLSSLPIVCNPNAGLPLVSEGKTVYTVDAEEFSGYMKKLAEKGVSVLGGCCGTTPDHIKATVEKTKNIPLANIEDKNLTVVSSYTHAVEIGKDPVLIGERINPTGKPLFKEALRSGDINYILGEGIRQAEKKVDILDVNVGLPDIDEVKTMVTVVKELQAVCDLPLQIDSSSPEAIERAMRIYNGKPLINSVNGDEEVMAAVFPSVKKYGGAVVALTIDKNGIPATAEGRVAIAEKIIAKASSYGIAKKDIIVDPLCLTVSADKDSALITLKAIGLLKDKGIKTSLGISNISFGLPKREKINAAFFTLALCNGLDAAIINPFSAPVLDAYYAFRALHAKDISCADYIEYTAETEEKEEKVSEEITLFYAVTKGLKEEAVRLGSELLTKVSPFEIIDGHLIPALDEVGKKFEEKKIYLPQLLMTADAATAVFDKIKERIPRDSSASKGEVILATVKGDVHDIGKNIVKVLLESYGFKVHDLGKDVSPARVAEEAEKTGCRLVGLSALMTTTVGAMEDTIKLLHGKFSDIKVMVGGAVLTEDFAQKIGADRYCQSGTDSVNFAKEFYRQK